MWWTLRNKLQWNFNCNSCILIHKTTFENVVWQMAAILSWPQCVKSMVWMTNCIHIKLWKEIVCLWKDYLYIEMGAVDPPQGFTKNEHSKVCVQVDLIVVWWHHICLSSWKEDFNQLCDNVTFLYNSASGLILGLHPANERRRRYFLTTSLIGWVQA